MESSIIQESTPAQPPKKRKPEYEIQNQEIEYFKYRNHTQQEIEGRDVAESPKAEKIESQDSPLDFSCKNGTDSSSSPFSKTASFLRTPNTSPENEFHQTWKPAGRLSNSPNSYQGKLSPLHNGFPEASPTRIKQETNRRPAAICKPQPTKIPANEDSVPWMGENAMGNIPMSLMNKYIQGCSKIVNASSNLRMGMNGLNSQVNPLHLSGESLHGTPYSQYPSYGVPFSPLQTNGNSTFSYSTMTDKKLSKNVRPFKAFENEILNYDPMNYYPPFNPMSYYPPTVVEPSPRPSPVTTPQVRNDSDGVSFQEMSSIRSDTGMQKAEGDQNCRNDSSDGSEFSNNQQDGQQVGSRRRGKKVPDEQKDATYFEKRQKNNKAAKRSRDTRRKKEDQMALQAKNLLEINKKFHFDLINANATIKIINDENEKFRRAMMAQQIQIGNLEKEIERLKRTLCLNGTLSNRETSKLLSIEHPGL